jgi:hypothetical protein
MRSLIALLFFFGSVTHSYFSQLEKNVVISNYEDKFIVYNDLGFSASPFILKGNFLGAISKLNYSHNFRLQYGIGVSYKWLNLHLNLPLPVYTKALSRFGENQCYGLKFNLNPKKIQLEIDAKYIKGFAIKNAYYWDNSLNELNPNSLKPKSRLFYFETKAWYFGNEHFKLKFLNGMTGSYNQNVYSWFANAAFKINSLRDDLGIVPTLLQNDSISKTESTKLSAGEFSFIPGFSSVLVRNNFQFSFICGIGGAIQLKQYKIDDKFRMFIGLVPRYEIGLNAGYSQTNYFIFLTSDFENISLNWKDFRYNQFYYALKIRLGYRFKINERISKQIYLTTNLSK